MPYEPPTPNVIYAQNASSNTRVHMPEGANNFPSHFVPQPKSFCNEASISQRSHFFLRQAWKLTIFLLHVQKYTNMRIYTRRESSTSPENFKGPSARSREKQTSYARASAKYNRNSSNVIRSGRSAKLDKRISLKQYPTLHCRSKIYAQL